MNIAALPLDKTSLTWAKFGLLGVIGTTYFTQIQTPSLPITNETALDPQQEAIAAAQSEMANQYKAILTALNRTNLSSEKVENPGLEQAATINMGVQLRAKISDQTRDENHPLYRGTVETGLVRSLLTNGNKLTLSAEVDNPTVAKDGQPGILVKYYSTLENKQVEIVLPPAALQVIAAAYNEALAGQLQVPQTAEIETAIQSQQLISQIEDYADTVLTVQAKQGHEEQVAQLQELQSQIQQEKQMGEVYVSPDGHVAN